MGVSLLLLEQMIDLDVDLGVEVTSKYMSAFTLMLREDHTRPLAAISALIRERSGNMPCAQPNSCLMSEKRYAVSKGNSYMTSVN